MTKTDKNLEQNLKISLKKEKKKFKITFLLLIFFVLSTAFYYFNSRLTNMIKLPYENASRLSSKYPIEESFNFWNSLVTVEGSWVSSTTDLAQPLQTTSIECWESFGHCWIMTASVDEKDGYLFLSSDIEEVESWDNEKITTKPSSSGMGCVEYFYTIDRKSNLVTSTRRTIDNDSELCKLVEDETIIMKLDDGYERIEKWKNN